MIARIDLRVHPRHTALLIEKKTHPIWIARRGIGASAACKREFAIDVAKQRKLKIVRAREVGVRLSIVEADAKDCDVVVIKIILLIAEPATLDGSSGSVSHRVKP